MLDALYHRRRWINLAGFIVCALLLSAAYYLQFARGMEPCPLCIFQRLAVAALAVVFLIAALHAPRRWGNGVYAGAVLAAAGVGLALAARHIYLQSLPPDQVPACGPGLDYMLNVFPLWDAVRMVLTGSGECAEVDRVLGLSIPAWTLAAFVALGLLGLIVNGAAARRVTATR